MKIFLFLLVFFLALPAYADEPCDQAITTIEINQCAKLEYQKVDKALNVAYQAALKYIETGIADVQQQKDTKQGLILAQRFWIQFRNKDCGVIYDLWRDGTIRDVMYWGCMTARTEQRTKELELFTSEIDK